MQDAFALISDTPVPTILIVAGLVFLFLSVTETIYGKIQVADQRKKHALVLGICLLLSGTSIELFNLFNPRDTSSKAEWVRPLVFNKQARPSFNCKDYSKTAKADSRPQSDLICVFEKLADADRSLLDHFRAYLRAQVPEEQPSIINEQRKWIVVRDRACLVTWEMLETHALAEASAACLIEATQRRAEHYRELMTQFAQK